MKLWKSLFSTVVTVVYWTLAWLGINGNVMAGNLFKFAAWVLFACTILSLVTLSKSYKGKPIERSLPKWFGFGTDLVGAAVLAAFGWFGYASLTLIQGLIEQALLSTTEQRKTNANTGSDPGQSQVSA